MSWQRTAGIRNRLASDLAMHDASAALQLAPTAIALGCAGGRRGVELGRLDADRSARGIIGILLLILGLLWRRPVTRQGE
jgi:hypothetical protein